MNSDGFRVGAFWIDLTGVALPWGAPAGGDGRAGVALIVAGLG